MILSNREISQKLRERATRLAEQRDNLYRVRAFRQAAMTVLALPHELSDLVRSGGIGAIERLPGVGKSLAQTLADYLKPSRNEGTTAA
ncbi:DNA-binding protein OS=Burkholderia cenocepacia GN=DT99_33995 PE=4 SV=1: HHH_8 [Gemmataceae bacterium]|jgi:Holliday junction DNA helicase RuvA|nr:DNA-binding protein OS=Burkholderia cenocepacia GN=DT99_33995 PE=4 SV=1: HHH_8 [Gemmataceae bacterium]VTT96922.1 DNA-binding protein OS=Burkholderia cenocepacia GN=DT99_33995 PE=4 SV=1: HHH_8 [Gemmataceae bacterium]